MFYIIIIFFVTVNWSQKLSGISLRTHVGKCVFSDKQSHTQVIRVRILLKSSVGFNAGSVEKVPFVQVNIVKSLCFPRKETRAKTRECKSSKGRLSAHSKKKQMCRLPKL